MKIAICDDENLWQTEAVNAVIRWGEKNSAETNCCCFSDTQSLLQYLSAHDDIDVILLDINFNGRENDGMTFAYRIRKARSKIPIIFLTNNALKATNGYLVEAMGYLLKPIDERQLSIYLNRVYKRMTRNKKLIIKDGSDFRQVNIDDIVYAESFKNKCTVHTLHGDMVINVTLTNLLYQLGQDFVQIHKSYIISKQLILYIKTADPFSVIIAEGTDQRTLPVGRTFLKALKLEYTDNLLETML